MPPRPASSLRLRALLEPAATRRANPDEEGPLSLWTQASHQEQPWILRGEFMELEWALDDASWHGREPGSLVRVTRAEALVWLGVHDAQGRLVEAPPLPPGGLRAPPGEDWVSAWEGPEADADRMLDFIEGSPKDLVLWVGCALAREVWPYLPRDVTAPRDLVTQIEGWLGGKRLNRRLLWENRQQAWAFRQSRLTDGQDPTSRALRAMALAAQTATSLASVAEEAHEEYPRADVPATEATLGIGAVVEDATEAWAEWRRSRLPVDPRSDGELWASRRREMAPIVRRYLSLGMVLLGRLGLPPPR